MNARLNYLASRTAGAAVRHVMSAGHAIKNSPLPASTQELVALRVSQINGCAVCLDMHIKDATAAGESVPRLNLVAAWREATVFTEAERAALLLAEHGTRIGDGEGVPDEVWAVAAEQFDDEQLTALVILISFMNMVNRLNVITRQPAGSYQPGQLPATAGAH